MQIQQGDVLIEKIDQLPEGCKPRAKDARGIVLAEGETTGHYHGIEETEGLALLDGPKKELYLVNETGGDVTVKHQEHKPVTIPPGIHEIGFVREHDYFQEAERRVVD